MIRKLRVHVAWMNMIFACGRAGGGVMGFWRRLFWRFRKTWLHGIGGFGNKHRDIQITGIFRGRFTLMDHGIAPLSDK